MRQSELHFVTGQAADLIPSNSGSVLPGQAIFFQAMLGYSATPSTGEAPLTNLLNALGFYVEYGSDNAYRPSFLGSAVATRNRYRLMQMTQSTESLSIYEQPLSPSNRFDWFREPITASATISRPIGENILIALFWPRRSEYDDPSAPPLTTNFAYDTKAYLAGNNEASRNQLPPFVQIVIVAIDEPSAVRLEDNFPGGGAPLLQPGALFTTESQYQDDLEKLVAFLQDERLNYRVFSTNVLIRQAKFSGD